MRHHQRPRGERHELPGKEERERVVGEHDQVHAGEEGREEGQHAGRGFLVPAVAQAVQARGQPAQGDHHQGQRRQRVDAEMRAEPRQSEGKRQRYGARAAMEKEGSADEKRNGRNEEGGRVDRGGCRLIACCRHPPNPRREERGDAPQEGCHGHGAIISYSFH